MRNWKSRLACLLAGLIDCLVFNAVSAVFQSCIPMHDFPAARWRSALTNFRRRSEFQIFTYNTECAIYQWFYSTLEKSQYYQDEYTENLWSMNDTMW